MASFTVSSSNLALSSQLLAKKKHNQTRRLVRVSCSKPNPNHNNDININNIDRRNVLLGLGGLYGLQGGNCFASAAETLVGVGDAIETPPLGQCHYPTGLPPNADVRLPDTCCPPTLTDKIKDYKLPKGGPVRRRMAAHSASMEDIAKYEAALGEMKKLDPSHPHSFAQQAKIHCAYCNGGYQQLGFDSQIIQVHFSWLFFPFHRWYLYFYEKILGSLIKDPTFALPYWNWDIKPGMTIPPMFTNPSSHLYDVNRNPSHLSAIVDLSYSGKDRGLSDDKLIDENDAVMYTQMVENSGTAELFLGKQYLTGDKPSPGMGSIENIPHTPIHRWVGGVSKDQPNGEDMGNFYSAGRDPLFYAHHANCDRMWVLWQQLGGKEWPDKDGWRNASFIFYDENAEPVRVYVKDCINNLDLGYTYEYSPIPWLTRKAAPPSNTKGAAAASKAPFVTDVFPLTLDKVVQVKVGRPKTRRSKEEKNKEEEVLVINGIEVKMDEYARFDVYLNDSDEPEGGKDRAQYAGGFAHLPHKQESKSKMKTSLTLGLTKKLENLGAEDDDTVLVTLAPQVGGGVVKVDGISIRYSPKY